MIACKKCRRKGEKLFLKGDRCYLPKCAIVKKNYPPGMHGPKGQQRLSDYGLQLSIKQKIKVIYGIREKQLKAYFLKVKNKEGNIAEMLLQKLESRLDSIVYRSGFATSRRQAKQMISHGYFTSDGRKIDIPSYQVKAGEIIEIKESKAKRIFIEERLKILKKDNNPADWTSFDPQKGQIKYLSVPTFEDIKGIGNIQLLIEYYSR